MVVFLLAFAVSCVSTSILIRVLIARKILDSPNERSSHHLPIPRGGGLAILVGLAVALAVAHQQGLLVVDLPILVGTALVAIGGALDDILGGVPPLLRLAIQTGAASWVVWNRGGFAVLPLPSPLDISLGPLGAVLAIVWMVALCNFYNFLDGIDGYAAGQGALASFGFLLLGQDALAATSLALMGACLGFMVHNWHPARVFMGDTGSGAIGFMLAALPFGLPSGSREISVFAAGLFLWFFLSDGLFTLVSRLIRGEKIWTPHRRHLYQRLVASGLPHSAVVVRIGLAGVPLVLLAAISCRFQQAVLQWAALFLGLLSFVVYIGWTRSWETRITRGVGD